MKDDVPSVTALIVACLLLIVGGDEYGRSLLPPGCLDAQVAILCAANYLIGKIPWILSNPILSKFVRFIQPNKGVVGIAFRESWIEGQLVQAVAKQGVSQVSVQDSAPWHIVLHLNTSTRHFGKSITLQHGQ